MANYGIKIAKVGHSVTSTTPADYHFWSKYRSRSIKYQGTLQVTTNSGTNPAPATATYTHNYGYPVQCFAFTTSYDGGYIQVPYTTGGDYGKSGDLWEEVLGITTKQNTIVIDAILDWFTPQSGISEGIVRTYTFDIILFMEEAETA